MRAEIHGSENAMSHTVGIDYDENGPDSYRGVVLKGPEGETRWSSGDPQKDWADYAAHASERNLTVVKESSLRYFLEDVPGWSMNADETGAMMIVPEDDPDAEQETLEPGMVFDSIWGLVKLYERVPGDGTQWHVSTWSGTGWSYTEQRIEPDDLSERAQDPEMEGPQP